MLKRTYHIQLHTPLGRRPGRLEAQIEEGRVCGFLDVLRHTEPFEGSIDADGRCCISGNLTTLMNTIPYTATGFMTVDALDLALSDGRSRFPVTGTVCSEP